MIPEEHQQIARQYVYAVVPAGSADLRDQSGINGGPVQEVRYGPVAALVTPIDGDRVRPSRANLSAHQHVVGAAHKSGPALPVRFGTVMPDERTVMEELLEPRAYQFESMLTEFDGKDEFRIKCRYLPDVPLREVVRRSKPVRRLRDRMRAPGSRATQADQMRLGEFVMAGLEEIRDEDGDALIGALSHHILAWEPIDDPAEDVPFHAAVLVDRGRIPELEQALERIAAEQRERMQVELIGPLPLWDFSHVSVGAA